MPKPVPVQDLYKRLMATSREAFEAGLYDAAYHSLTAALHCARALPNDQALREVERAAKEQLAWIDEHLPGYRHSTRSAGRRGHKSILLLLARQAAATVQTRQVNRARENTEE